MKDIKKWAPSLLLSGLLLAVAAPVSAASFLWEVASLSNRVYLYGTVHAGKKEWYPLERAVEDALDESEVLVVEADITNEEAMKRASTALAYAPPDSLKNHVAPADYVRFQKLLPRYKMPEEQAARMKPFMAVSLLVFGEWSRLGYLPDNGVDAYLIRKAKSAPKRIIEIEGMEEQIRLIDSLSENENRAIFEGTLYALESGLTGEQITGMVNAWQAGDPSLTLEIARKYNENVTGAPEFEEKFVWSRHAAMLGKIDTYLADSRNRYFIAVGSLHLAGPRGLVEQLRKRGYIVKQR